MSPEKSIDIKENDLLKIDPELLAILLKDKTTGNNIIWATDNYAKYGEAYFFDKEITIELITSRHGGIIKPRIEKSKTEQQQRVRQKAEVFTPSWICNMQNNKVDEEWFGRKVLDIYATSIDYNPSADSSVAFFKQVQNKMHWAAHKHTAAEIIYERADSDKQNMGLTSWSGKQIKKTDVEIAKNYLSEKELDALNKIVTAYLDIAEVRALDHEPMYMKDWLETIDDYLKMTRREILTTAGRVSHKQALDKAHDEYKKYKAKEVDRLSLVEKHFLESIRKLENKVEK